MSTCLIAHSLTSPGPLYLRHGDKTIDAQESSYLFLSTFVSRRKVCTAPEIFNAGCHKLAAQGLVAAVVPGEAYTALETASVVEPVLIVVPLSQELLADLHLFISRKARHIKSLQQESATSSLPRRLIEFHATSCERSLPTMPRLILLQVGYLLAVSSGVVMSLLQLLFA